jgi:hypothetical protein
LILAGGQIVALGLLGELSVWQHFNSSSRPPYSTAEVVEARVAAGSE